MTTKNASHYRRENLEKLFAQNRKWVGTTTQSDPDFFLKLSEEQLSGSAAQRAEYPRTG